MSDAPAVDDDHDMIPGAAADDDADPAAALGEIDWAELWAEFGFENGPDGKSWASETQLVPAIESSEQDIDGNPMAIIEQAEEEGILHKLQVDGPHGETHDRGYVYDGGDAA